MGSGDPYGRQLEAVEAGASSLSKICLVERYRNGKAKEDAATEEADIDYTLVRLGTENNEVDVAGTCGNMASAIGPYAYNSNLLPSHFYSPLTRKVTVNIRNTNTSKLISSTFQVVQGQAAVSGDYTIDQVSGRGASIELEFKRPYGSKTGKVLPTGRKIDVIQGYKVTCVDGATPAVFVRADDVGIDGTILPNELVKLPEKLDLLESIRHGAAVAMGIAKMKDRVPRTIPKIGIVSMSSSHPVLSGATLRTSQMDLVVRFISDTQPHCAIPLTVALTTAVAARISGTVVEQLLAPDPVMEDAIVIGHASGRLQVSVTMNPRHSTLPVSATVYCTAKRLMEGKAFWSDELKQEDSEGPEEVREREGERHSLGIAFVLEQRGQESSHLFEEEGQENLEGDRLDQQQISRRSYQPLLPQSKDVYIKSNSTSDANQSELETSPSTVQQRAVEYILRTAEALPRNFELVNRDIPRSIAPEYAQLLDLTTKVKGIALALEGKDHLLARKLLAESAAVAAPNMRSATEIKVEDTDASKGKKGEKSKKPAQTLKSGNISPSSPPAQPQSKIPIAGGMNWHSWARKLHERKEGARWRAEKEERKKKGSVMAKQGLTLTGRKSTGKGRYGPLRLNEWGELKGPKQRAKTRREG